jgi:putative spermidine/putrescine transport system permease protein
MSAETLPAGPSPTAIGQLEAATRRRSFASTVALVTPGLLGLTLGFIIPLLYMIRMSFNRGAADGVVVDTFTLEMYAKPLGDPYYWKVIRDTFLMGLTVAVLCAVLSYPIALFLARTKSRYRSLLMAVAIAPLLTSAVVRTYGWMVILGPIGLLNGSLKALGYAGPPLELVNNMPGVVIGLVEIFMPYAILAMISGFGRLSTQLEEAAGSLGANKFEVFRRITLPLSLPGVLTGFLLAFVLSISTFITPRLLGGGVVQVLATEIYDQTTGLLNWPFAAALSVILLILFGLIIGLYQRLTQRIGA